MSEYAWVDRGDGRKTYRRVRSGGPPKRSDLAAPRVLRDSFDKPVQSMANGRWYESKRGLAASHRASGNPHGQDFIELGNEEMPFVEHKTCEAQLRNDIRSAIADVESGNLPPVLRLDD